MLSRTVGGTGSSSREIGSGMSRFMTYERNVHLNCKDLQLKQRLGEINQLNCIGEIMAPKGRPAMRRPAATGRVAVRPPGATPATPPPILVPQPRDYARERALSRLQWQAWFKKKVRATVRKHKLTKHIQVHHRQSFGTATWTETQKIELCLILTRTLGQRWLEDICQEHYGPVIYSKVGRSARTMARALGELLVEHY